MFMKTLFVIIGILSFTILLSQESMIKINKKLLSKYDKEYLEDLQKNDPEKLEYLNFYADNCYKFMQFPTDKQIPHQLLYKVNPETKALEEVKEISGLEIDFNPFEYNCKTDKEKPLYYKIGDTGQMIMMRSEKELSLRYRAFKNQQK
ncbi:MAG: hypothetical protein Kow0068_12940 [Marinilabiliales bacterium]